MRVGWRHEIQGSDAGVIEVNFDASCGETHLIRAGDFTASGAGIGVPDLAFSGA
ncbi:hypothetical protein OAG01_00685 [bacterium]|nr:hypothetical protein [bacterium]MDA7668760.1 hypothetical protein [bacterium]MDB4632940.1 hypothetical protein [bacterium]